MTREFQQYISEETQEDMKILNICEYPFSDEFLKAQYRKMAFKFHPDVSSDETKKEMIKVNLSYTRLRKVVQEFAPHEAVGKTGLTKRDMFDFSEPCARCEAKGYTLRTIPRIEPCPDCQPTYSWVQILRSFSFGSSGRGLGYHFATCPNCQGSGKKYSNTFCIRCDGTGKVKKVCKTCNGKGVLRHEETILKESCIVCHGVGRIEIHPFNPVIRKGAILK